MEKVRVYYDVAENEVYAYFDRPLMCNEVVWAELELMRMFGKPITWATKPSSKEFILIDIPNLE